MTRKIIAPYHLSYKNFFHDLTSQFFFHMSRVDTSRMKYLRWLKSHQWSHARWKNQRHSTFQLSS
uniref:Uncharacterized protein n=1 Tax=Human betaherpesvirus 6 TaxID=10368 RepID=A0A5P9VIT4_9BETA|nr:hypothetical protein [Human betaherpesvirus 6]QFX63838.1 hypothetical protein [Human betaherpesvirus 6]